MKGKVYFDVQNCKLANDKYNFVEGSQLEVSGLAPSPTANLIYIFEARWARGSAPLRHDTKLVEGSTGLLQLHRASL